MDEELDDFGNPVSGDRLIYCCFPNCGCEARGFAWQNGAQAKEPVLRMLKACISAPMLGHDELRCCLSAVLPWRTKPMFKSAMTVLAALLFMASPAFAETYTVTITDPEQLAGITAAREEYNAQLAALAAMPELRDVNGVVIKRVPLPDNQAYIQMHITSIAIRDALVHKTSVSKIDDEMKKLQNRKNEILLRKK